MSTNNFDYEWDYNLHNGMGGWRITERENEPFRDADGFLTALNKRMS